VTSTASGTASGSSSGAGPLVGTVVDTVQFEVERGKIREFARATLASDLVHTDAGEAESRGHSNVLATATHVVVSGHHRDQRAFVELLGLDIRRVVVGSTSWDYARPLQAGDTLTGVRTVVGDETRTSKGGGTMRLVTLETSYVDATGAVAVQQREVLIERGRA
jgi:acyl dehydratase